MTLLMFIGGTLIGSFLNVCIYRLPQKKSIWRPRSACMHCASPVPFYLNIPVLSFLILKGRCHSCHHPISRQYPVVEFLSGVLTAAAFFKFGFSPAMLFYTLASYFLIVISFIDLAQGLIYNKQLLLLLACLLCMNLAFQIIPWPQAVLGFLAGGFSLFLFALLGEKVFAKESMGMGDVKMAAVLGFMLGWKMVLPAMFAGFFIALLVILFIAAYRRQAPRESVPMAPFFTMGTLLFIYWGPALLDWYWHLFITRN
ncbi:MAG: prepilin peptidase [Calditrichia bacterium]